MDGNILPRLTIYDGDNWVGISDSMIAEFRHIGIEPTPDMIVTDNFSIKLYVAAEDDAQDAAALMEQAKP